MLIFHDFGVGVVTGSVWTIPVEVSCYARLPLILWVGRSRLSLLLVVLADAFFDPMLTTFKGRARGLAVVRW